MIEFKPFPKLARMKRNCVVTEKIDGTNAQIYIVPASEMSPQQVVGEERLDGIIAVKDNLLMFAGSRSRFLIPATPGNKGVENFGFAAWVQANQEELWKLGPGQHFGEWWGSGIQRTYGLKDGDKRFSLFNTGRWRKPYEAMLAGHPVEDFPTCCHVVPVLAEYTFDTGVISAALTKLVAEGSVAAPGFMNPEGVVVFHSASGTLYKITLEHDGVPKSLVEASK
jgi:hypothetical protein